jgi:hypothetical protein
MELSASQTFRSIKAVPVSVLQEMTPRSWINGSQLPETAQWSIFRGGNV